MTRKTKNSTGKFTFKGFVNIEFNDGEKESIGEWIRAFKPELNDCLVTLVESGYKVGISWSDHHDANQIALTCRAENSPYYGHCFVLVHVDVEFAVSVMRYVYDTLLKTELYQVSQSNGKYDW